VKSEESFLFMPAGIKQSFHDCHLKESLIRENLGDPGALLFPRGDL